jgi:hypothetical protein
MLSVIFAALWGYFFINSESKFLSVLYFLLFAINAIEASKWIGTL